MKKLATLTIALLLTLIFSGMVFAQGVQPRSQEMPRSTQSAQSEAMSTPRASEIIGKDIKGQDGQKIGEVEDLILSKEGNIDYLVISQGGTLGIGDELKAVPWKAANVSFHEKELTVGLSKDKFDSAPSFSNWDEFGPYEQQVRAYYGEQAGGSGSSPGMMDRPMPRSEPGTGTTPGGQSDTGSGTKKY